MDIGYLIQLLNSRLNILANARDQAFTSGDLDRINSTDTEIFGVQDTLVKLNMVANLSSVATAANTTPAVIVASGVDAIKNTPIIPSDATACLLNYDLSTYAADPLYLQKITDILQVMPAMDSAYAIDAYISNEAIGSPLTGTMIITAAQQFNVDNRLLVAILELESNFGTAGVAVSTLNPGNVGNTGTTTQTYASWQDGVAAVAQWLSNHCSLTVASTVIQTATSTPPIITATTTPVTAATSTSPVIPPVNTVIATPIATSTDQTATSTDQTTIATSTPSIDASSTQATVTSSSTPLTATSTTPIATSTDQTATSTDQTTIATSTPSIDASSTQATVTSSSTPLTATSTPDTNATSTAQAIRKIRIRNG